MKKLFRKLYITINNMEEQFETLNSRMPDMASVIAQRIAAKTGTSGASAPPGTVDPYKLMVNRKNSSESNIIDTSKIVTWPENDVKLLQDYCTKMGIVGFNSGRTPPLVALSLLKKQLGDDYTNISLEERVPVGYEKLGSSGYGSNYPYTDSINKKQILHG